jgi:WD40 repeat protein/serine/threonine protein kinase
MSQLLICPRGHQWQPVNGDSARATETVCPVCGVKVEPIVDLQLAEETFSESVLSRSGDESATVVPVGMPEVPGYTLLRELSRSPVGVVTYKASQLLPERTVFLKLVEARNDPRRLGRDNLLAEIELCGRLQHPNIARIYDVGERDGLFYCALEYADGGRLADKLAGEPMTIPQVVAFMHSLASVVDYLHVQDVLHRGLSPASVFLTRDGAPRITDFGSARYRDERGPADADVRVGDLGFLAPEQVGERVREISRATDVYGLGAILYGLLTGRPPFRAKTAEDTLDDILYSRLAPPSRVRSGIPADLEAICLKCLRREPRTRYRGAADLASELRRFQRNEPVLARPIGMFRRFGRWVRRGKTKAAMLAVILLAALAVPVAWIIGRSSDKDGSSQKSSAKEIDRRLREAQQQTQTAQAREQRTAYILKLDRAQHEWRQGHLPAARQLLDECPVDMRGWEWHYLQRLARQEITPLEGHGPGATFVALSPSGGTILSAGQDRVVRAWNMGGQRLAFQSLAGHLISALTYSPTGKQFASGGHDGNVTIWNAQNGQLERTLRGHTGAVAEVAFSPDGARLGTIGTDHTLRVWDAATGNELFVVNKNGPASDLHGVSFSPDSRKVAAGTFTFTKPPLERCEIKGWEATTGADAFTLRGHYGVITAVTFSPDGKHLASSSLDDTVRIWDRADPKKVTVLSQRQGLVPNLTYSRDGSQLSADGFDSTLEIWDTATGKLVRKLKHPAWSSFAISPDRQRIVCANQAGQVELWLFRDSADGTILRGHTRPITGLAYNPNGGTLASVSGTVLTSPRDGRQIGVWAGELKLWDTAANREAAHPRFDWAPGPMSCVAFLPDNRVATGCWNLSNNTGEVKLWDTRTGGSSQVVLGLKSLITSVACSRDGRQLAYADNLGNITVRDVQAGVDCYTLNRSNGGFQAKGPWNTVLFSPDGQRLAAAGPDWPRGGGNLKAWDASRGWEQYDVMGHNAVRNPQGILAAAFSADGSLLATAGADDVVTIWQANTGKEPRKLIGHAGEVTTVTFHPDGKRLVSGGRDGTVRIWDPESGQELFTLRGFPGPVSYVAFSPDGARLAVASDKEIRIMDGSPTPGR